MKLTIRQEPNQEEIQAFASALDIDALPSLPFSERRSFPDVPAIYFVKDNGVITYIGEAGSLRNRRDKKCAPGNTESCVTYWIEVEGHGYLRRQIEKALILRFLPPLNRVYRLSFNERRAQRRRGDIPVPP